MNHLFNLDLIILFFFLGVLASWAKSDLEFPDAASKFLSIFLLLSLGLKGGHEVRIAEDLSGFGAALFIGLSSCVLIPLYMYFWLKKKVGSANAAALSACYGSVSAVTLITAQGILQNQCIAFSGYMVALMALMEIPAIVLALYFYRAAKDKDPNSAPGPNVLAAKSVVLLLGGFLIGFAMSEASFASLKPVVSDAFKGVLAFFLLDLGIIAQRQLSEAWRHKYISLLIGCLIPLVNGSLAILAAIAFGLGRGDQVLIAVLAGSASYIAAPAAIRASIPEASPSLYIAIPLSMTFPMNVLFGIPFYIQLTG